MPPWLREKIGTSRPTPGPSSNPSCPLAIGVENPKQVDHPRTLPPGSLRCRLDADLRGTHVRPGGQRILESRGFGAARGRVDPLTRDGPQLLAHQIESEGRGKGETGEVPVVLDGPAHDLDASRVGARRPGFQLADVPSPQARLGNACQPLHEVGDFDRELQAPIGNQRLGMRRPRLCHERQRVPDQPLADRLRVELCRGDASGSLPQGLKGKLQRPFELLGTPGEQEREDRIAQQAGLDEVRAGDPEIGEGRLKRGTVPQGDRDGFLRRQPIVDGGVRRKRRRALDANTAQAATAYRGIHCAAVWSSPRGGTRGRADQRKQPISAPARTRATAATPRQHGRAIIPGESICSGQMNG